MRNRNPRVEVPFDVERSYDVYYSYLDVSGRTVVVLTRSNVVDEIGDQHVKVSLSLIPSHSLSIFYVSLSLSSLCLSSMYGRVSLRYSALE